MLLVILKQCYQDCVGYSFILQANSCGDISKAYPGSRHPGGEWTAPPQTLKPRTLAASETADGYTAW